MKIRHFLAKGFNEIPLKDLTYATEHTQTGDAEGHVGWKIKGAYNGDNERQAKHRYEIIFTPDEAREFRAKLDDMLSRFDESVSTLLDRDTEVGDVEESDDEDDGAGDD